MMRPIDKFPVGTGILLDDGTPHTIREDYVPYRAAKSPLCVNIGPYCAYCEAAYCYKRDLHVEHVLPKDPKLKYARLSCKWDNFLLSCGTCNGTDNKGTKVMLPADCHFPHLNNTYLSLRYAAGGVVTVNPHLQGLSRRKAEALLELVGLDKTPMTSKPGDTRWKKRQEAWTTAEIYKKKYEAGSIDLDCVIDYVRVAGFWSIWFTVFGGCDEVRRRLIEDFPGTSARCFDARNHYCPLERNPGLEDPV